MNRRWFLQVLGLGTVGSFVNPVLSGSGNPDAPVKPRSLKKGDTIGLVSPASRLHDPSRYDEIITQIKKLGYRVKVSPNARNQYGYFSGRDSQRADDLNAMFADDTIDAVMAFRGGWGANRILDKIDYNLIKNNPKILVGYSDITALLVAIYARTGLITFHGPVGKSVWTDFTTRHFNQAVSSKKAMNLKTIVDGLCEDCNELQVITPGKAKGKLLGGNLTVLTSMLGSDYLPDWENTILFLEDVGENVYRIDRMLTQLKLNGVLDKISGFIFGQCTDCDRANTYSLTLNQVFDDHIKPLGIPAFSGALFGHVDNMLTFPIGLPAGMDAQQGTVTLSEGAVS